MKLVTTFHHPTPVVCSVKCRLSSRDLEHLVVGTSNALKVYSLQPEGLNLECALEIWGRMLAVRTIPIPKSAHFNIVVMLDHPDPELIFLSYADSSIGELSVVKRISLSERLPRPAEFFNDILLDPTGRVLLVSCYIGKLKIVILESGMPTQDFDVTLPELNVLSITFLHTARPDEYGIVLLHLDHQERIMLVAHELSIDDLELHPEPSTRLPRTVISSNTFPTCTLHVPKLVPIPPLSPAISEDVESPSFNGGVLVLGGRRILLYEMSTPAWQERARGKAKRLEKKKHSTNSIQAAEGKEKEKAREAKKRKSRAAVEWPWSDVSTCCEVEDTNQYLIADGYGRLATLSLGLLDKHGLVLLPIGKISPPTTLTYLTSQTLFVGSYFGDSQLVRISASPLAHHDELILPIPASVATTSESVITTGLPTTTGYGGKGKKRAHDGEDRSGHPDEDVEMTEADYDREFQATIQAKRDAVEKGCIIANTSVHLKVVDAWQNIAPIHDATLVDLDGNGQSQVITCSGGKGTGSIRVVRNGADFRELATISGLENIVGVWPVKLNFEDRDVTHLAISTSHATHLFEFVDTSLRLVQHSGSGFVTNEPTLALANIAARVKTQSGSAYGNSSQVVQVTSQGVHLLDYDSTVRQWVLQDKTTYPREIVAATINPSQIFVAQQGGKLCILNVPSGNSLKSVERTTQYAEREVSAICGTPLDGKLFTKFISVAYWQDNSIQVYQLNQDQLKRISTTDPLPAVVHSLVLHNFGAESSGQYAHPYLLAGLGNGSVMIFPWVVKGQKLVATKVLSLGHRPVSLSLCDVDGNAAVLAAGSRATVISWDGRRLRDSPIMLKNIVAASRFSADRFRSCLILANQTGLVIGSVKDLNKLHIRSIPLGSDTPQRIIHDSKMKAFGVVCTRTTPVRVGEAEMPTSSFKLIDELSFENICEFSCDPQEELTAAVKVRQITHGKIMSIYCLGSLRYRPVEIEPTGGRLIALTASHEQSTQQISVLATEEVGGCVYALAVVGDLIAAAVNSSIMLYKLEESDDTSAPSHTLKKLDEWNHNYVVTSLVAFDKQLLLGDHMCSISLVDIKGEKLVSVTKDYAPLWPVSLEASTRDLIIGANDTFNLFSYSVSRSPHRTTLERDGLFHLGELVTRFIRGSLLTADTSSNVAIKPEYVFMTSVGRIGVIVDVLDKRLAAHLSALQRNMSYECNGPGGSTLAQYRAPKSSRGSSDSEASFGFLDGDFLEQFLTYLTSQEHVQKIVQGRQHPEELRVSVEETKKILEALQAMH